MRKEKQTVSPKGQLWSWHGAAVGAVREDSERGGRKAVASGLLAWRDALREVGLFSKPPVHQAQGEVVLFIPLTTRIIIIVTEVERIQATWSKTGQSLSC